MLGITFKKAKGLPHISKTLQCDFFAQVHGSQWRQRRIEHMCVERKKLKGARAQNNAVTWAHVHTMHICGPKNPCTGDTWSRMKILDGILPIQLGIECFAGRLGPVNAHAG